MEPDRVRRFIVQLLLFIDRGSAVTPQITRDRAETAPRPLHFNLFLGNFSSFNTSSLMVTYTLFYLGIPETTPQAALDDSHMCTADALASL